MSEQHTTPERYVRLADLGPYTGGLSKPSIYRKIREGSFPRPIRLGINTVAWSESSLVDWQQQCAQKSACAGLDVITPRKSVRLANAARRA